MIYFKSICDIPLELLKQWGIKGILIDTDNTIAPRDSDNFLPCAVEWIEKAKNEGFKLCIVSNGRLTRVARAAKFLDMPFVCPAYKPLPGGFKKAVNKLGLDRKQCIMVGDQVITDMTGARWVGIKGMLVEPVDAKTDMPWTKLMRKLFNPARAKNHRL